MPPLTVLFEDNHLLVVNKPCGIATMGTRTDQPSLARQAACYIKNKYNKPGNVFVGVVSRLDAHASGVLVLARTSKAASRLSDQIRRQTTTKRYLAWVEADVPITAEHILVEDYLSKNDAAHRVQTVKPSSPGSQLAQLRYCCCWRSAKHSVLEVELVTGRKHQIRVQLASRGLTIYADSKYGSSSPWPNSIGLHCYRNVFEHPTQATSMRLECWPNHWRERMGNRLFEEMLDACRRFQTTE